MMSRDGERKSKRLVFTRKKNHIMLAAVLVISLVAYFPFLSLAIIKNANNPISNESPRHSDTWNKKPSPSPRSHESKDSDSVGMGQDVIPEMADKLSSNMNDVAESSKMVTESNVTSSSLPYLVIHMGPDKTGTTFLQNFLRKYQNLLGEDGYDVSYSKGSRHDGHRKLAVSLLNCFIFSGYQRQPCHKTQTMEKPLSAFRDVELYPHLLWSTEGFRWANFRANPDWPWFLHQIQSYRTIRIIVVYRRYFDWIASRYQEDYRSTEYSGTAFSCWPDEPIQKPGITIPTFGEYYQRDSLGICPDSGARALNDCKNYFANRLKNNTQGQVELAHPLLQMVQPLLESNLNVTVINLHGENDLLQTFFCQSLPTSWMNNDANVSRACQQAQTLARIQTEQQEQQSVAKQTQSVLLHQPSKREMRRMMRTSRQSDFDSIQYDMIGLEAHRLQILPSNITRHAAKEHVRWYHEVYKKDDDLPMSCPSKTILQSLEATSYRFEQELLQLDIGRRLVFKERHSDGFARALEQNKFCNVNVTKVLEDEEFVAYLRNRTLGPKEMKNHRPRHRAQRQNKNP